MIEMKENPVALEQFSRTRWWWKDLALKKTIDGLETEQSELYKRLEAYYGKSLGGTWSMERHSVMFNVRTGKRRRNVRANGALDHIFLDFAHFVALAEMELVSGI